MERINFTRLAEVNNSFAVVFFTQTKSKIPKPLVHTLSSPFEDPSLSHSLSFSMLFMSCLVLQLKPKDSIYRTYDGSFWFFFSPLATYWLVIIRWVELLVPYACILYFYLIKIILLSIKRNLGAVSLKDSCKYA